MMMSYGLGYFVLYISGILLMLLVVNKQYQQNLFHWDRENCLFRSDLFRSSFTVVVSSPFFLSSSSSLLCFSSIFLVVLFTSEEFKCKNRYIYFFQFEIFAIKAAENKENKKKICDNFHHNFKNIPYFVTIEVSLKRFKFALFNDGLTLKTLKLHISVFAFKLFKYLHIL